MNNLTAWDSGTLKYNASMQPTRRYLAIVLSTSASLAALGMVSCADGPAQIRGEQDEPALLSLEVDVVAHGVAGSDDDSMVRFGPNRVGVGERGSQIFSEPTKVVLRAVAGRRSIFRGFSGACSGTETSCTVDIDDVTRVTAEFERPADDVLVIVNDNSRDSALVGEYFAAQRGIDPSWIVHVRTPPSFFINWEEFQSLRDQIIVFMQQHTLDDPEMEPAACVGTSSPYYCEASMEQLRQHSTVRYIVTTRGVPTRTRVDYLDVTQDPPVLKTSTPSSVDNYLTSWLINYHENDVTLVDETRETTFLDGRGMRTVRPADDHELIVSRVDGLDLSSAKSIVDRALEAERNGIYGKLYTASAGGLWLNRTLRTAGLSSRVYGVFANAWRYQLGIWGEAREACTDHLEFEANTAAGKSPPECLVRLNAGTDAPPGNSRSRQPLVHDALAYFGWLDGQPTNGSFDGFRNWRRDDSCSVTLCRDAADPAACREQSTDIFREINTACMGVADGFIGFNYQSYPVSYLTSWPTAWYHTTNTTSWGHSGGGGMGELAFPVIRDEGGHGEPHALFFENTDQVDTPLCFEPSSFDTAATVSCPDRRTIRLLQRASIPQMALDAASPQSFTFSLWARAEALDADTTLQARLFVHEVDAGSAQIAYPAKLLATLPAGDSDWLYAEVAFQLDPALHPSCAVPCLIDGLKVRVDTQRLFVGALGIDTVSLKEQSSAQELLQNGEFDLGHEQVAAGDHAANFLSRLNGTAFFGSLDHHRSGGHSFSDPVEPLIYFMRGLPYADAIWFGSSVNSGVVYGDPFYSPVAVWLHYPEDFLNRIGGSIDLFGSTVNGRDLTRVETIYTVDYCNHWDFFECDREDQWLATGLAGQGGVDHQFLGTWETPAEIGSGPILVRLRVTSTHLETGRSQSFYDYLSLNKWVGCDFDDSVVLPLDRNDWGDSDRDGVGNPCEEDDDDDGVLDDLDVFPRDGAEWLDTDSDGTGDNADPDDDGDGMPDDYELGIGFDPLVDEAALDVDGDGVPNIVEYRRGSDPTVQASVPVFATIHVDAGNGSGVEDGTPAHPFRTLSAAVAAAGDGDTIEMAPGVYDGEPGNQVDASGRSLDIGGNDSTLAGELRLDLDEEGQPSRFVTIRDLEAAFVWLRRAEHVELRRITVHAASSTPGAIWLESVKDVLIDRALATHPILWSVSVHRSTDVRVESSTLSSSAGPVVLDSDLSIEGSIVHSPNGSLNGNGTVQAHYTLFDPNPNLAPDGGVGVLVAPPQFVDLGAGDYHLKSSSPAVDAGDPAAAFELEPAPNGGRLNLGFYGNTTEAAVSP